MNRQIYNAKVLGETIREARKKQSLTQEDLAGITGTGRRIIGELERGKETAQIGKALHILSSLGISLHASTKWD